MCFKVFLPLPLSWTLLDAFSLFVVVSQNSVASANPHHTLRRCCPANRSLILAFVHKTKYSPCARLSKCLYHFYSHFTTPSLPHLLDLTHHTTAQSIPTSPHILSRALFSSQEARLTSCSNAFSTPSQLQPLLSKCQVAQALPPPPTPAPPLPTAGLTKRYKFTAH